MTCAAPSLIRAITMNFVNFASAGGLVTAELLESTDWASITFTGARHRLRVELTGQGSVGAAADFLAALTDLELPIAGHIVADLALISEARRDGGGYACLELEALTIADG